MRVGIFDIGTRATRLLIGDTADLAFRKNFGRLTRMGEDFDRDNNIRSVGFQKLISVLREFLLEGARFGVQKYVAVGTAALRRARNCNQLEELLQNSLGLHLSVLEEEEEAYLSLLSAFCHFQHEIQRGQPILLIDQGGGSTEISCGEMINNVFYFWGLGSLDLGSVLLKNIFLANNQRVVGDSYRETMRYIEQETKKHQLFSELARRNPVQAFGMGSAITNITGKRGNRRQHGCVITLERMQYLVDARVDLYEESQMTIEALIEGATAQDRQDDLERDLLVLYGLPVYQYLLQKYHLDRITVCGYGLRYGVFLYLTLSGLADRTISIPWTQVSDLREPMYVIPHNLDFESSDDSHEG